MQLTNPIFSNISNELEKNQKQAPATANTASAKDSPESIVKAATQFESLLIGELLKSAREAGGDDFLGTSSDDASSSLLDLSQQQLSQALAAKGGLGMAKFISDGLTKASSVKR